MATVRQIWAMINPLFDPQVTTRKRQRSALDGGNVPCMHRGAGGEICREVARRGVGAERRCERHYFANRIALGARYRSLGLCRCGRAPMGGLTPRQALAVLPALQRDRSARVCRQAGEAGAVATSEGDHAEGVSTLRTRLGARLWRAEIVKRQAQLEEERAAELKAAKRRARAHAPLNERQAAFVRAYVLTGNTAGSYREAGYTARPPNVAKVEGYWMRRRPHVKRAIAELRAARQAERDREIERDEDRRRAELAAFAMTIARSRPPHSRIGQMARRIVGLCACGAEPDSGFTTCCWCRAQAAAATRRARDRSEARARERELGRQGWRSLAGVREADRARRSADRSARFEAGRAAEVEILDDKALVIFAEIDRQCQWRSKKGPPRRCKKGPLGGCGLVPVVHGRAPRATRRALNRLTRRRAREGPVGPRGQAWAGWSVQLAVGV